jgi:hypothetical protein
LELHLPLFALDVPDLVMGLEDVLESVTVLDVGTVHVDVVTPPSASVTVLVLTEVPVPTYGLVDETPLAVPDSEPPHRTRLAASRAKRNGAIRRRAERAPSWSSMDLSSAVGGAKHAMCRDAKPRNPLYRVCHPA